MSLLNDNGITYGKFIPNLDYLNAERNIMISMKNIAWVGIRNTGGRVVVEVDEMVKSPEIVPLNVPCNIVSTKDAQIINAKVYCGKLIPKVGEGVKKGDIIISGATTDKRGKSSILHAQGEIIGQYKEKMVFTQNFQEEVTILSGEEINKKEFQFFGIKIPLFLGEKVQGEFEYEESTTYFSFFNITIPVGITHEVYRPFTKIIQSYDEIQAEENINNKISDYEENFLKNSKILLKETQKNTKENQMQVIILYTIEGPIGINKEFMAKN